MKLPKKSLLGRFAPDLLRTRTNLRQVMWRYRALPGMIIIGGQKCGTTSLFSYLSQHPQLAPSCTKEVHYFDGGLDPLDDTYSHGEPWYRAHFPLSAKLGTHRIAFEASPFYLCHPLAPERIKDLVPNVKLIALLRNPTERAISHYFHSRRHGREQREIEEALQLEDSRLDPILQTGDFKNPIFRTQSYKYRGKYKDQIERFLKYFPRERILILESDRFFSRPAEALSSIYRFLGVDPSFEIADLVPRNVGRNRREVSPDLYSQLDAYFAPHNDALYRLLNEKFDW